MSNKYKDITVLRWYYRSTEAIIWADDEEEALEKFQRMRTKRDSAYYQPLETTRCKFAMMHPNGKYVEF